MTVAIAIVLAVGALIATTLLFKLPGASVPPRDDGPGMDEKALASLQTEATEACKCARVMTNAKGMEACWTRFNKRVEKLPRGLPDRPDLAPVRAAPARVRPPPTPPEVGPDTATAGRPSGRSCSTHGPRK